MELNERELEKITAALTDKKQIEELREYIKNMKEEDELSLSELDENKAGYPNGLDEENKPKLSA